jgi:ribose 1,5-bisphosphokinase PhnN
MQSTTESRWKPLRSRASCLVVRESAAVAQSVLARAKGVRTTWSACAVDTEEQLEHVWNKWQPGIVVVSQPRYTALPWGTALEQDSSSAMAPALAWMLLVESRAESSTVVGKEEEFAAPPAFDSLARVEHSLQCALGPVRVYRIEDSSSSYAQLQSAEAPFAVLNGWAVLRGPSTSEYAAAWGQVLGRHRRWLLAVCGDSGSGKDTVVALARALAAHSTTIVFPKKVLNGPKFDDAFFALRPDCESGDPSACTVQWRGSTIHHGVHLPAGPCVAIVNVSCSALPRIAGALPSDTMLAVVSLAVPLSITQDRLRSRNRDANAEHRIARNASSW